MGIDNRSKGEKMRCGKECADSTGTSGKRFSDCERERLKKICSYARTDPSDFVCTD